MTDFARARITLEFDVGTIDGASMAMRLTCGDQETELKDLPSGPYTHTMDVLFPSTLKIDLSGKGPNDTQVDAQGCITGDKFIKLVRLLVDGHPTDPNWACRFLTLQPVDREPVITNYWGFNGQVKIEFDRTNAFVWLVGTRRP